MVALDFGFAGCPGVRAGRHIPTRSTSRRRIARSRYATRCCRSASQFSVGLTDPTLSSPLQKCITKTAAAPVMIFFLARPGCPPGRAPSLSRYPERTILPLFPFSFHCLYSGVRISVVGGCVSAALLHTTFDHLDSDSGALSPIRIDLQAFSSCSPALRTTPKSTSELRSLISLRKRLAPFSRSPSRRLS